jgi:hypothetical protein
MKSISLKIVSLLIIFSGMFLFSCEEELETPEITVFTADVTTVPMGEPVNFTIEHTGTYAVIWTGEPGANYDTHLEQITNPTGNNESNIVRDYDIGAIVSGNKFQKRYRAVGTFTALLLVTNVGDLGHESATATQTIQITVTD